jgi:hypothetical protein
VSEHWKLPAAAGAVVDIDDVEGAAGGDVVGRKVLQA